MAGISIPVDFQGNFGELTSGLRDALGGEGKAAGKRFADGFQRDAQGKLRDARGRFVAEGSRIGTGFSSAFGKRLTSDLGTLGKTAVGAFKGVFQGGLAIVGAAAGAGIGVALNKGLQRLTGIENAQAKLRGLGNSAQDVEDIMGNALAAVKGTAFGLDEAATVAASAVTAGIKPGAQLEQVLKNVANTAAASGTTMEEMGAIFNRVATNGKASNQELQQLADRGINIYGELAKQLGVTNEEVFKLASDGKISFQQFSDAAKAASGTVADEMGKTVTGSIANLKASLGRIGAGVMGGVFSQMAPLIQDITAAMEPLEDAAKGVGEAIGEHFSRAVEVLGKAGEVIKPLWDSLSGGAQAGIAIGGLAGAFLALSQSIAPLLGPVGKLLPTLGQLRPLLGVLTGPVGAIAAVFAGLVMASGDLREALTGIFDGGIAGVQKFAPIIQGQLGPAMESFQSLLGTVWSALGQVGDALAPVVTSLAGALAPILGAMASNVLPALTTAFQVLEPAIGILGAVLAGVVNFGINPLVTAFEAISPAIAAVVAFIGPSMLTMFQFIAAPINAIRDLVGAVGSAIEGDWSGAWQGVLNATQSALGPLSGLIESVMTALYGFWSGLWPKISATVTGAWRTITTTVSNAIGTVRATVTSTLRTVQSFWTSVWNSISRTTRSVWNTIRSTITTVVNTIRSTITNTFNTIRSTITSIINAVRSAISNTFNSIRSTVASASAAAASAAINAFGRLRGGISNAIGAALAVVRGLPGRLKSAVGNLGSLLYSAGRDLIMGLARGITNALGAAASAAARVAGAIRDKFPGSPVKDGPLVSWNNGGAGVRLAGMLADGLNQSTREVSRASVNLARSVTSPFASGTGRAAVQTIDNSTAPQINQNFYGPTTSSERLREMDWTVRNAVRTRTFETAGMSA